MKRWIWAVEPYDWDIVKERKIWATYNRKAIDIIEEGDVFIIYVRGTKEFRGIFEVISDWYETSEKVWTDELKEGKIKFPYQVKLKPIALGSVRVEDIMDKLEFVKSFEPYRWISLEGMRGLPCNRARPISEADYHLILDQMRKAQKSRTPSLL